MESSKRRGCSRSVSNSKQHLRCRHKGCEKRYKGHPGVTPCPRCGHLANVDSWASQRPWRQLTCHCDGYAWSMRGSPHRRGTGSCNYNPLLALPEHWQTRINVTRRGCWEWTGEINRNGYGRLWQEGRRWMTHIAVYVRLKGEYDRSLVLDHKCENRACCNPKHLEPVTPRVNTLRGKAVLFQKAGQR